MPIYDNVPILDVYGRGVEATLEQVWNQVEFDSVLDVGAGHGGVLDKQFWDARPIRRVACDFHQVRPSDGWEIENGVDVQFLTEFFPEKSFDIVNCFETLEHVPNCRQALEELCKVARKLVVISSADEMHHWGPEYEAFVKWNPACKYLEQPKISDLQELGFEVYVEANQRRQIFAWKFIK